MNLENNDFANKSQDDIQGNPDLFSFFLKDMRQRRGFTITDLALKSGLSQSYISRLEMSGSKDPSISLVIKLANALRVDPSDFLRAVGFSLPEATPVELINLLASSRVTHNGKVLKRNEIENILKVIDFITSFKDSNNIVKLIKALSEIKKNQEKLPKSVDVQYVLNLVQLLGSVAES